MLPLVLCAILAGADAPPPSALRPKGQPPVAHSFDTLPFVGVTVGRIEVDAPGEADTTTLRELIAIAPGDALSRPAVQQAISRLYALGRFAQVRVLARRQGQRMHLRIALAPLRRLVALNLMGGRDIDLATLRRALGIKIGAEVDSHTADNIARRAEAYLHRAGYPDARVDVTLTPVGFEANLTCSLVLRPGRHIVVTEVRFAGSPRLPHTLLQEIVEVRPGKVLNLDVLEADRTTLQSAYVEHGFLRAQVATPRTEPAAADTGAIVTFTIHAGPRIALHARGNHAFDEAELVGMWPEQGGAIVPGTLTLWQQRIAQAYARKSYLGTRVQVRWVATAPAAGAPPHHAAPPAAPTGAYIAEVHEGQPVRVEAIEVTGVSAFDPALFITQIRALLEHELDPQTLFEPLGAMGPALRGPHHGALDPAPIHIPYARRWVPSIYQRARDEIAAAYHDMGFLQVVVASPTLMPLATLGPNDSPITQVPCGPELPGCTRPQGSHTCDVAARLAVVEGPQTFIESIDFGGNAVLDDAALLACLKEASSKHPLRAPLEVTQPLSQSNVEDGRIDMLRAYRDRGYLYARVSAEVVVSPDNMLARLRYAIEEGPQVHVERVLVRGNDHTRQGVIKSRMAIRPGGLFRLDEAVADQRSIAALGTFSAVRVKLLDESHVAPHKDVVAEVTERPRQPIDVAAGISTTNGPRLRLSYAHIDVAGTASMFTASLKVNRQIFFFLFGDYADILSQRYAGYRGIAQITRALEREGRLSLHAPPIKVWPFDPVVRLDVVDQRVNAVRYSLDATTAIVGVDLSMPWRIKSSMELQAGLTNLECPLGDACNQNLDVRRLQGGRPIQEGEIRRLKFGPQLIVDRRDGPINPRRGALLSVRVAQAFGQAKPGAHFEPFAYTKYEASATGYVPLGPAVLALSGRAGAIALSHAQVPVDDRFFLGGRDSLRGFVESTLIPQDACVVDNPDGPLPPRCAEAIAKSPPPPLSLGGNTYALVKTELRLPIRGNLWFDLFVDVGNLWVDIAHAHSLAPRIGTGGGLRYQTPVGALAIDVGINPAPRAINAEPAAQVHFSIGSY